MSESSPPLSVTPEKDVRVVEFTNSKILDEANIKEIGDTLAALIDEQPNPKLLIDFGTVDHLSSAALGMLINVNNRIKKSNGQLRAMTAANGLPTPPEDPDGISIPGSLRKFGLEIQHRKVPIDHVVVDHIEKTPTEN